MEHDAMILPYKLNRIRIREGYYGYTSHHLSCRRLELLTTRRAGIAQELLESLRFGHGTWCGLPCHDYGICCVLPGEESRYYEALGNRAKRAAASLRDRCAFAETIRAGGSLRGFQQYNWIYG
ncbi:hypothetical protein ZWY2020_025023 [Hordeum vulgare]|nr:hypothetical protein ZWY2020_025023 [Hordeum vulgare]